MMVITIEVESRLQWLVIRKDSPRHYIAVCDAMGLTMEADTLDELESLIEEAMELVLTDLLADDELERFLRDRGWQARNLPVASSHQDIKFDVPWELIMQRGERENTERRPH